VFWVVELSTGKLLLTFRRHCSPYKRRKLLTQWHSVTSQGSFNIHMPKSRRMSWSVHKLTAGCNGYKTICVVIYTRIPVPCFGCHSRETFAWAETETYCKLHKLCPYLGCYNGHIVLQSGNQIVCVSSGIHAHLNLVFQFVSRTWYITSGCDWNMGGRRGDRRRGEGTHNLALHFDMS